MNEASKTNAVRGPGFAGQYLTGKVIDIGCGNDLVVPWAEPFDKIHGDAARVGDVRERGTYDAVHSSHCLEHMPDPVSALADWWSLLKPGGYIVTVVPDEELYEQGLWPSLFNWDHKWAFTMDAPKEAHVMNVVELHRSLPGAQIVDAKLHDLKYSRRILARGGGRFELSNWIRYCNFLALAQKIGGESRRPDLWMWDFWAKRGVPIDQTRGEAMAQIQVIARKAA